MSTQDCHRLAEHISALLQRTLGEGIEPSRMVAQPLYARDVLLVCQALRDTELPSLAERFVRAHAAYNYSEAPEPPSTLTTRAPAPDSSHGGPPSEPPETTPSGWMASLWPATMRGGWLGKRNANKPPRRS